MYSEPSTLKLSNYLQHFLFFVFSLFSTSFDFYYKPLIKRFFFTLLPHLLPHNFYDLNCFDFTRGINPRTRPRWRAVLLPLGNPPWLCSRGKPRGINFNTNLKRNKLACLILIFLDPRCTTNPFYHNLNQETLNARYLSL